MRIFIFVLLSVLFSCHMPIGDKVIRKDLSSNEWQYRQAGTDSWKEASVPGNVISELKNSGEALDPFYRYNEDSLQWVEDQAWEYRTRFSGIAGIDGSTTLMIFHGLDTYGDVYLNDSLILQADNMYRKWEVDVTDLIQGDNELRVYFHALTKVEKKKKEALGYIAINSNERAVEEEMTRTFSRKAPFHYGWDWGPRLVTSGIWRGVELVHIPQAQIKDVYYQPAQVSQENAQYTFHISVESNAEVKGELGIALDDSTYVRKEVVLTLGMNQIAIPINVNQPQLWWCRGYGDPNLYKVDVTLTERDEVLDRHNGKLGIRSLRLVQEADDVGRSFYFELNGIPVFAKGANYIPGATLTTEVDESGYRRVLQDAIESNMNMLRVWGGAIYEDDIFYDLCDEEGILVWQDFMFACETTPPVEAMFESIRQEAISNVKRLRNHACISLWCGDNENLHGWNNWGWKEMHTPEIDSQIYAGYLHISREILPSVVDSLHPEIEYWSTSPSAYPGDQPADRLSGDEHDWTIWFGMKDFEAYGERVPRFVSEYGVQSLPEMRTMQVFADSQDLSLKSAVMDHRQRSRFDWMEPGMSGNDVILKYIDKYYDAPQDFASTVYLSQLMQARALKTGIELHRKNKPYCMGSLYWQINDCWPTVSWATVDYYGRWKAAHYRVREAFDALVIVPEWNDKDALKVTIVNDDQEVNEGTFRIFAFPLNKEGTPVKIWEKTTQLGSKAAIAMDDMNEIRKDLNQGLYFELEYNSGHKVSNVLLPERPKALTFRIPEISLKVIPGDDGLWEMVLSSSVYAHGVALQANIDGKWSDNFFNLIPGMEKKVTFRPDRPDEDLKVSVNNYANYVGR